MHLHLNVFVPLNCGPCKVDNILIQLDSILICYRYSHNDIHITMAIIRTVNKSYYQTSGAIIKFHL